MDIKVLRKDFKNMGGYKTKVTDSRSNVIDDRSVTNLQNHINKVTDTLFLGLSRGVRLPALYTGRAVYNTEDDTWDMINDLNRGAAFFKSASVSKSGDQIQTMDIIVDSTILSMSDSTPLYFVYNTSTVKDYANDYVLFPRVSDIQGSTITIAMESNNAGTWGYYESTLNGETGLSIGVDCLLQSTGEASDYNFYTPGVPDWTYSTYYNGTDFIQLAGWVYNTILETGETIDWDCKVRGRYQEWSGDCTTGSAVGDYLYITPATYSSGLHKVSFKPLSSSTLYKLWIQIDSEIGPDNLDWQFVGCFATTAIGNEDRDIAIAPL